MLDDELDTRISQGEIWSDSQAKTKPNPTVNNHPPIFDQLNRYLNKTIQDVLNLIGVMLVPQLQYR